MAQHSNKDGPSQEAAFMGYGCIIVHFSMLVTSRSMKLNQLQGMMLHISHLDAWPSDDTVTMITITLDFYLVSIFSGAPLCGI